MLNDIQFLQVKKSFNYIKDIFHLDENSEWYDRPEEWEDSALIFDQMSQGKITGDCNNFVLACRHLLDTAGIKNRIILCKTQDEYHLVCEVDGWILDNTQPRIRSWSELSYEWIKISGFEKKEPWHEIGV